MLLNGSKYVQSTETKSHHRDHTALETLALETFLTLIAHMFFSRSGVQRLPMTLQEGQPVGM